MSRKGLPIPVNYGCFSKVSDLPIDQLQFPLVVKPDGGSLSENVFTELNSLESLQRAALQIELLGKPKTWRLVIYNQSTAL